MAKHDLVFTPPLMNATGILGFIPDQHGPIDWSRLGAFVTNPISLNGHTPARGTRFVAYPGGFLLHTGFPNPGFSVAMKRYSKHWNRSPVPVIVHLMANQTDQVAKMVRHLEAVDGVSGLELGIPGDAPLELVVSLTQAATGELPLIIRLPLERSLELAQVAIQAGAMAISLAAPRGALPTSSGELVQGRLYGPGILPTALLVVQQLVHIGIPTIGAGGVYRMEQYKTMLTAGAVAVQLDGVLWREAGYQILE